MVVVTHRPMPEEERHATTHVVGDVGAAVTLAQELAGQRSVTIASANIASQALDLGLVDEIAVSLVPVVLGRGIPYFAGLRKGRTG